MTPVDVAWVAYIAICFLGLARVIHKQEDRR